MKRRPECKAKTLRGLADQEQMEVVDVDPDSLAKQASAAGVKCPIEMEEEEGCLARLSR